MTDTLSAKGFSSVLREWAPVLVLGLGLLLLLVPSLVNVSHYWTHNPLYGYGWFVPFASLYLMVRNASQAGPFVPWNPLPLLVGIGLLCLLWLPLRTIQIANPDWRLLDTLFVASAIFCAWMWVLALGGRSWLVQMAFPLLLLLTALPWPMRIENFFSLQSLSFIGQCAGELLWWLNIPNRTDGVELHTVGGSCQLNEACSGIRSFHIAVFSSLFLGAYFYLNLFRRISLFFASFAVAFLFNVVRVAVLAWLISTGMEIDRWQRFHDLVGQFAQVILVLLIFGVGFLLRKERVRSEQGFSIPTGTPSKVALFGLAGLGVIIPSVMALSEIWYLRAEQKIQVQENEELDWSVQIPAGKREFQKLDIPLNVRELLPYDEGESFRWNSELGRSLQFIWMRFDGDQYSAFSHSIHRPNICLPSQNFQWDADFAPLAVSLGEGELFWQHQAYHRDQFFLHLFYLKSVSGPAAILNQDHNWDAGGRIELARNGWRIQEARVGYLMVIGKMTEEEAKEEASRALESILKPRE